MKFTLLFVLLFLFSTSCGLFNRKTAGKSEIQKSNEYQPVCEQPSQVPSYEVKCSSGQPICGTRSGSDDIKVYCIDENNEILTEKVSCCTSHDGSCLESLPGCEPVPATIQKDSNFTPVCEEANYSRVECSSGGEPVCGTTLKNADLIAYCIRSDDTVISSEACCKYDGDICLQPTRCIQLPVIQKNSAFVSVCEESGHYLKCLFGDRHFEESPACGTKPGSGDLLAYCIDENDQILGRARCCESEYDGYVESSCRWYFSRCTQLIQSE